MSTHHYIYLIAGFLSTHGIHGFLASMNLTHNYEWSFYSLVSLTLMSLGAGIAAGAFFSQP